MKVPTNETEEKEQFDRLYKFLVQSSIKAKQSPTETITPSEPSKVESSGKDEFSLLRLDLLSNFQSMGIGITPLQTCKGCDGSFYSEMELEKHWAKSPACSEWSKRNLEVTEASNRPFFEFLEDGLSMLLSSSSCKFCNKKITTRKAHDKHLQQSMICNRLAHDTFLSWIVKK